MGESTEMLEGESRQLSMMDRSDRLGGAKVQSILRQRSRSLYATSQIEPGDGFKDRRDMIEVKS